MHHELLVVKTIGLELQQALNEIIKMINYVKIGAFKLKIFAKFCKEMGAQNTNLILHTEIRWLSTHFFQIKRITNNKNLILRRHTESIKLKFYINICYRQSEYHNEINFLGSSPTEWNVTLDEVSKFTGENKNMSIRKKTKFYCTYDEISKNSIKVNTFIWLKDLPNIYCKKVVTFAGMHTTTHQSFITIGWMIYEHMEYR